MKIESIDFSTFAVSVSFGRDEGWQIPVRLASLVTVATDCQVPSILCALPDRLAPAIRIASEKLVARNPIVALVSSIVRDSDRIEPGRRIVGKGETFFCVGDSRSACRYSLFLAGTGDNADRASRCAHILAVAFGYTNDFSFEIRLGVYELLMNVIEHGIESDSRDWIQVDLEREGDTLLVSIIDQGVAFDPSKDSEFDLQAYIGARKKRGLGLIMTHRIAEQFTHHRESGFNMTLMKKSVRPRGSAPRAGKEKSMVQFKIEGSAPLGNGSNTLTFSGDLDAKGALLVEQMLAQLMEKKVIRVTLDFEKVSFISSAGVGILLGLVSSLRDAGGDAVFTRVPLKVSSVFHLLNLEDYFTISDSITADA
ncbi:MAG: anti-sigma factor antagonist [Candidatus Krumholzibacteria bacterium]|nr:anti-sigma factor antagonist [Candidatus Krumholzibacteria bacterium]